MIFMLVGIRRYFERFSGWAVSGEVEPSKHPPGNCQERLISILLLFRLPQRQQIRCCKAKIVITPQLHAIEVLVDRLLVIDMQS